MRKLLIILCLLLPSIVWAITLQVNITGVDAELIERIKADLTLQQATTEPKLTPQRIRNLYDLAPEQISSTMQAMGYYRSTIDSSITNDKEDWSTTFIINPGPPTTIRHVSLTTLEPGANDRRIQKFLVTPKLVSGQILTHENYEDTKEQLLVDLNAQGYLRADFTKSTIEVDRTANTADITLELDPGKLYRFGKITFIDSRYPDSLLVRYIPFRPGDPYSIDKLMQFQENLEAADLFSKIRFDPIMGVNSNDLFVPINVRLTPKPRNRYSGSVGYGTDTGFRGSLAWLHRFSSPAGHKLLASISASAVKNAARLNYSIPGKEAATDSYNFGLIGQTEKFDDVYSRKAEIYANKVMRRNRLESIYGISFFTENFHLTSFTPNGDGHYLLPNVRWIWRDAHEAKEYQYGTLADLSFRGGVKGVLSDNSVFEARLHAKQIVPISNPLRLILRGDLGAIASNNFGDLPPSLRFYTGGDYTVRGYAYNTLGPTIGGEVVGGKYLLVGSAELEHTIYDKLNGVVFFDLGNATMKFITPLASGAGAGVRYKTPIGDFRLDVAKPLSNLTQKHHWRIHFNFGTDF